MGRDGKGNAAGRSSWRGLGPGILVAATGVGAGDLATGAFTGNHLGVTVLWAVLLGALLKYVLNEGLARWQLATGETLLEGAMSRLGPVVTWIFLPYLILWSFFVGTALMAACGVTAHAIFPVFDSAVQGKIVFGMLHSVLGLLLVSVGGFALFKRVMTVCIVLMFGIVMTTAILVCDDWGAVAEGLFVPAVPAWRGEGLGWTIALIGGVGGTLTVLCYGYWMRESGRLAAGDLRSCRQDLALAYGGTALFGMAMVIIGAAFPPLPPGGGATLVVRLADLLESILGPAGKWIFLVGAWSAVFSSLLGVWQSVPYLFADFWSMRGDARDAESEATLTRTLPYRTYLFALALVSMIGLYFDFRYMQKVYAVCGALFMPLLAVLLLYMNGRRSWVGRFANGRLSEILTCLAVALFLVFGYLQLRRQLGF